jgi:PEP-CTERM motif
MVDQIECGRQKELTMSKSFVLRALVGLSTVAMGAALASALVMPASAAAIDNPDNGEQIFYWGPSAVGGGQSYGDIFTAPQSVLNDFTFTVAAVDTNFPFVAQVYAWNGTAPTGSALYTSGLFNTTLSLTPYTFTPNISLTASDQYVAFVTNEPNGVSLGGSGNGEMEASDGGTGGAFEFVEGDPVTGGWQTYSIGAAEFHADFSDSTAPVPEPFTLSLFGAGVAGAAVLRRRKKKAA